MSTKRMTLRIIGWCCAVFLFVSCGKQDAMPPANNTYKTMTVNKSDIVVESTFPAKIQGRQDVEIYPQISGLITKICIEEGAMVKKGQTLFIIDPVPYQAALQTALANVESAEAAVANAQMTVESKEELHKENIVSDFDLKSARNSLRQQKAALSLARAELTNARNNLSYTEIKSPVDGIAGMIPYRVGALVNPSISIPLIRVSDNTRVHAYFSMTEKQLTSLKGNTGDIKETMSAVKLIMSDGTLYSQTGEIDAVSGVIDEKTGSITLRAVFDNSDHQLRSGSTGKIMVPYSHSQVIVIPKSATFELQDKVLVYKVIDGMTKSVPVTVLPVSGGKEYIVNSGLTVGDVIIAEGAGLLQDGVPVENEN